MEVGLNGMLAFVVGDARGLEVKPVQAPFLPPKFRTWELKMTASDCPKSLVGIGRSSLMVRPCELQVGKLGRHSLPFDSLHHLAHQSLASTRVHALHSDHRGEKRGACAVCVWGGGAGKGCLFSCMV